MQNTYAIMELAALSDSVTFRHMMNSRQKGLDITPKCKIPGTIRQGVTHFSNLSYRIDSSNGKILQSWLNQFCALSPVILYISSHHVVLPPTPTSSKPSKGTSFYSNSSLVFEFIKGGVQLFSMVEDNKYSDARTTVRASKLGEKLVLLIIDGCNMHGATPRHSGAIQMQNFLSTGTGKPIVIGYDGTSRATSEIYRIFLNSIPRGTDFSLEFARNTQNQNRLIKYWMEAGKKWRSSQAKIMSAVDNRGQIFDNKGNLVRKSM